MPFESHGDTGSCGIAASTGLAFGPAHVVKPREFSYERRGQSFKAENEKLKLRFIR